MTSRTVKLHKRREDKLANGGEPITWCGRKLVERKADHSKGIQQWTTKGRMVLCVTTSGLPTCIQCNEQMKQFAYEHGG